MFTYFKTISPTLLIFFFFSIASFLGPSEDRLPAVLLLLAEIAEFRIESGARERKLATGSNFVLGGTIEAKSRTTYER